jgi:hypothetical protein
VTMGEATASGVPAGASVGLPTGPPTGLPIDVPAVHPGLGSLAGLVGTWSGRGSGHYPTIADFEYLEEVRFSHDGRPVLRYEQRTRRVQEDVPMHVETGYLRRPSEQSAELLVVHPTGLGEVAHLTVDRDGQGRLVLDGQRTTIVRSATAKAVEDVRRRFVLDVDTLTYDVWMTYAGHPDEHHLTAVLQRRTGGAGSAD